MRHGARQSQIKAAGRAWGRGGRARAGPPRTRGLLAAGGRRPDLRKCPLKCGQYPVERVEEAECWLRIEHPFQPGTGHGIGPAFAGVCHGRTALACRGLRVRGAGAARRDIRRARRRSAVGGAGGRSAARACGDGGSAAAEDAARRGGEVDRDEAVEWLGRVAQRCADRFERQKQSPLVVPARVVGPVGGSELTLVASLVEVGLLAQHERLDGDEHLPRPAAAGAGTTREAKPSGSGWVGRAERQRPLSLPLQAHEDQGAPTPAPCKRCVREHTCSTVDDCGFQSSHDWRPVQVLHRRRLGRELGRQLQVKHEDGVLVWSPRGTDDERTEQVGPRGEGHNVDALGQPGRQQLPLLLRNLAKSGGVDGLPRAAGRATTGPVGASSGAGSPRANGRQRGSRAGPRLRRSGAGPRRRGCEGGRVCE
eukprot:scaffold17056_cov102-Isochrysis_galbana.AAC.5